MSPKSSKTPAPSPSSSPGIPNPITLTDLYARLFHNSRSSTRSPTIHIPPNATRAQIAAILAVELRNDNTIVYLPNPSSSSSNGASLDATDESAKQPVEAPPNGTSKAASSSQLPDAPAEPIRLRKGIDYPLDAFDRTPSDARERLAALPTSRSSRLLHDEELLASPLMRTPSEMSTFDPQEISIVEGTWRDW